MDPDRPAPAQEDRPEGEPDFRVEVARLGRLIRAARGDRFSIEGLARTAGVSAGLLSQVERGIGNPSFQTLGRVARALGMTMPDLFAAGEGADDGGEPPGVVRADARRRMMWPLEHLTWDVLTPSGTAAMTVMQTVVPPGFRDLYLYKDSHYEGWLFQLILSGRLLARVDDTTVVLDAGDALTCHSSRLKWVRNETEEPVVTLAAMCPGAM